jgi:uncharacterized protein YndB with AHSA1/START domain
MYALAFRVALTIFAGLMMSGCATIPPVGTTRNAFPSAVLPPDQIRWPEAYKPELATFTISNTITIAAPPQVVWNQLIHAESWPQWYEGATGVTVEGSSTGILQEGSTINWTTMDQDLVTKVVEFVPPYRMGWESRKSTLKAYHAWLLIPIADGTQVVTDESQFGLLAHLQRAFLPNKLRNLHDVWLTELKTRAEAAHGSTTHTQGEGEVAK